MNFLVFILISLRKTTNILDILYRVRDFFMIFYGRGRAEKRAERKGCGDGLWGWAGTDATPAAFYLGLCRLHGILSPPSATTTFRRRAISTIRNDGAAGGTVLLRSKDCCRRNDSTLRQRKLESDAATWRLRLRRRAVLPVDTIALQAELFFFAATTAAGGTNLLCGNEN